MVITTGGACRDTFQSEVDTQHNAMAIRLRMIEDDKSRITCLTVLSFGLCSSPSLDSIRNGYASAEQRDACAREVARGGSTKCTHSMPNELDVQAVYDTARFFQSKCCATCALCKRLGFQRLTLFGSIKHTLLTLFVLLAQPIPPSNIIVIIKAHDQNVCTHASECVHARIHHIYIRVIPICVLFGSLQYGGLLLHNISAHMRLAGLDLILHFKARTNLGLAKQKVSAGQCVDCDSGTVRDAVRGCAGQSTLDV